MKLQFYQLFQNIFNAYNFFWHAFCKGVSIRKNVSEFMSKILSHDSQTALPQLSLSLKKEEGGGETFGATFKAVTKENHKAQNAPEEKHQEHKRQDAKPDEKIESKEPKVQKKQSVTLDFPSKKVGVFLEDDLFEVNLTDLELKGFHDFLEQSSTESSVPLTVESLDSREQGIEQEMPVILRSNVRVVTENFVQVRSVSLPAAQLIPQIILADKDIGEVTQKLEVGASPMVMEPKDHLSIIEKSEGAKPKKELEEAASIPGSIDSQTPDSQMYLSAEPFQTNHRDIQDIDKPKAEQVGQTSVKAIVLQGAFPALQKTHQASVSASVQLPSELEKGIDFEMHVEVQRSNPVITSKPFVFEQFIPQEGNKEESTYTAMPVKKTTETFMQLSPEAKPLAFEKAEMHTLNGEFLQTVKEQFEKFQRSNDKKITVQMRANGKNLTIVFNSVADDQINILFRTTDKDWQSLLHHSRDEIAKLLSRETIDIRYLGE